ncbi:hypothetical protein GCM10010307_43060 [Streptomyces vastus]|uniref:Solute-binding protein family 5 domain-containing protein n=1 Tax=Streptomyces vastus TaxID=285451 RepID=A0ABN3R4B9_9ACTN
MAGADPIGEGPDTLRVVLPEEPPTLEPCDASLTATGRVTRANITEALTEREPSTGRLEQALATKWTRTSPTSWTFKLRKGVMFHDGTPLTAEAAAFSIKRATDSDIDCNVDGYIFTDSEVTATPVNDMTLEVRTARSARVRRFLEGNERELARRSADLEALTRRFCMFVVGQLWQPQSPLWNVT